MNGVQRGFLVLVLGLAVTAAWLLLPATAGQRLVHVEPSTFAPVLVVEENSQRCMTFSSLEDAGRQSCQLLANPDAMVFAYTRMMMAGLFVNPSPQRILMIGLGGGTLPMALGTLLPEATIDSVEIDPAVLAVAERFFGYRTGPRQRVTVGDGRAFVEEAVSQGRQYDMVLLDAFDVDYIPPRLLTVEFFQHIHRLLAPGGVFVANSFTLSQHYERESATYAAVFGEFFNLRSSLEGNRVVIAAADTLPDDDTLTGHMQALTEPLQRYGIDARAELERFVRSGPAQWPVPPLTDTDGWTP